MNQAYSVFDIKTLKGYQEISGTLRDIRDIKHIKNIEGCRDIMYIKGYQIYQGKSICLGYHG